MKESHKYFLRVVPHLDTLFRHAIWKYAPILWHSFWHATCHLFWHSFWHATWHLFWHSFSHFVWHLSIWHIFWHSLAWALLDLNRRPQILVGWGPAVPTVIRSSRLKSCSAHCDLGQEEGGRRNEGSNSDKIYRTLTWQVGKNSWNMQFCSACRNI